MNRLLMSPFSAIETLLSLTRSVARLFVKSSQLSPARTSGARNKTNKIVNIIMLDAHQDSRNINTISVLPGKSPIPLIRTARSQVLLSILRVGEGESPCAPTDNPPQLIRAPSWPYSCRPMKPLRYLMHVCKRCAGGGRVIVTALVAARRGERHARWV